LVAETYRYLVAVENAPRNDEVIRLADRRPHQRRWWLICLIAIVMAVVAVLASAWISAPAPTHPKQLVLEQLRDAGEPFVALPEIPRDLRLAVVATEDERFFHHHGIDLIGLGRAAAYDLSHGSVAQGGSTLTEQLVKLLYFGGNDDSPWRKLQDAAVAVRLESELSKDQILDLYLNDVYFGEDAYGVGAASERYFAIPPSRLDLARASLLAGVIQDPAGFDPFIHPHLARERQAEVLRSMVRHGYIADVEGLRALREPILLKGGRTLPPVAGAGLAPQPGLSGTLTATGSLLLVLGVATLLLSKRLRRRHVAGLAGAIAIVSGLVIVARSIRTA
jgi:membrane peptidoglycan carboxypeptidase